MAMFNARLKMLRQEAGLSQADLAQQIGTSKSSINMYERGEREPGFNTLEVIADYFGVDVDYLLGKSVIRRKYIDRSIGQAIRNSRTLKQMEPHVLAAKAGISLFTLQQYETDESLPSIGDIKKLARVLAIDPWEIIGFNEIFLGPDDYEPADLFSRIEQVYGQQAINILQSYDTLNQSGKTKLAEIADHLSEIPRYQQNPATPMRSIPVFASPAAAGSPLYAESDFEYIDFPITDIPIGIDFGIRISGNSMEPTIKDGSIIWVEKSTDLHNGDIGVFMLNDSAVCKRLKLDELERVVELQSDNPDYTPITGSDLEGLRIVGRVII